MSSEKPKGILRNAPLSYEEKLLENYDRKQVLANTQRNAELYKDLRGDKIRNKLQSKKSDGSESDTTNSSKITGDELKWDEKNLTEAENNKSATMKIDEPKTPYQGAVDPSNDYYRSDNEDDDLGNFSLGESEHDLDGKKVESLNGGIIVDEVDYKERGIDVNNDRDDNANYKPLHDELDENVKHSKFEEMRKQHYAGKGLALKQKISVPDDDEEEESIPDSEGEE